MKRRARACPDCGSPAKGNPCYLRIDRPSLFKGGADAPCYDALPPEWQGVSNITLWTAVYVLLVATAAGGAYVIASLEGLI